MAAAALPSHIIGKMTKQGGHRARVVVFKFASRLPQIRGENFHRGQINLVAPASRSRNSILWGQASDRRRRVLAALRDVARGGSCSEVNGATRGNANVVALVLKIEEP
jgi:hypothetical protein